MKKKIVFCGDESVGKTSIITRLADDVYKPNQEHTIGAPIIEIPDTNLQVWDTAGQMTYRNFIPIYLREAQMIILVFAVDNLISFQHLGDWIDMIRQNVPDSPIYIVANKSDLPTESWTVTHEQIEDTGENYQMNTYVVSAANGSGIDILKGSILEELEPPPAPQPDPTPITPQMPSSPSVQPNPTIQPQPSRPPTVNIDNPQTKKPTGCC